MRPKILPLILCSCVSLLLTDAKVLAQAANSEASDSYVNAYSECQNAEKLEGNGNLRGALKTYKEAAHMLDGIAQHWPNWNPTIVDYRRKKTAEAIARLSNKVGPEGASVTDEPTVTPPTSDGGEIRLPPDLIQQVPDSEPRTPRHGKTVPPAPVAPGELIGAVQKEIQKLQDDNARQAGEMEKLRNENTELAKQLKGADKARQEAEEKQRILQDRADAVEKSLNTARNVGTTANVKVKELQEQYDKAHAEVRSLQIERDAAEDVRKQIAGRLEASQKKTLALQKERDDAVSLASGAKAMIEKAQKETVQALAEKDKLNIKLTTVIKERDDALQQVVKMKEAQKQVDKLVNDNTRLMAQLSDAEKQISQFKADGLEKDGIIAGLKKEVGNVQQQLSDAKKESASYQTHMGEIQEKLNVTAANLATAKADGTAGVAERKKAQEENEVLRGIVMREMKEQARRDQTRKLVLGQMSKLGDKSGDLLKQISYLSEPVVKLSPKERAIFKKPQVEISDNEISLGTPKTDSADPAPAPGDPAVADAKPAGNPATPDSAGAPEPAAVIPAASPTPAASAAPEPATPTPPVADVKPQPPAAPKPAPVKEDKSAPLADSKPALSLDQPATDSLGLSNSAPPMAALQKEPDRHGKKSPDAGDLPKKNDDGIGDAPAGGKGANGGLSGELAGVMQQAKDAFERGNYHDAEKLYEKVLAQAPTNLNALDNLGVVRFRSGKLKLAEEAFRKAIASSPEDAFSHCTLGIVYYSQSKYDEAVNELTKALAINPKNATAHNYLGITASQKGWQEAAQKELETATALDPSYADAQFNLAVVFGTQQPPNKENARKYYRRAIELGAEPDSSLEQLLK